MYILPSISPHKNSWISCANILASAWLKMLNSLLLTGIPANPTNFGEWIICQQAKCSLAFYRWVEQVWSLPQLLPTFCYQLQGHCYKVCFVQTQPITVVCPRSAVSTVTFSSTPDCVTVSLWFRKQWTSQHWWPSKGAVSAQRSPSVVHKRACLPKGIFIFWYSM